jgi:aspartate/methionine/tyrosine aminotransferase
MMKAAKRGIVPPFIVMDVMRAAAERAAAGGDVLHLEVGQPGGGPPRLVLEAAKQALDEADLGYTLALGLPALRERIARFYAEEHGIAVRPERVVVTTGSSGAFVLAFLAAFDIGEKVALAAPGYPAYRNILSAIGTMPISLPVDGSSHFQPAISHLATLPEKPDGLIIASPSNPTGSMLSAQALGELAAYCHAQGIRLISDEIYHGITYEEAATSALAHSASAIIVNSFSKYYAMTGWRLGWLVLPEDLIRPVECLAQNLFIAPPTISQHAALAVFEAKEELDERVAGYRANRDILLNELPSAGFGKLAPADGAFYLYADVGHLTDDSEEFCKRILANTGVAVTPGIDFDPERGARSLRFSFAGDQATIIEAAKRLKAGRY